MTCHHCDDKIDYDDVKLRWFHVRQGSPVKCLGLNSQAWPAQPKSRDRPFARGLWGNAVSSASG